MSSKLNVSVSSMIDIIKTLNSYISRFKAPVVDLIDAQTHDPEKILIATILSARTRDKVTASVVKSLFKKINKISDFNRFSIKQIEKMIYPVGFYKNKAQYLKKLPVVLEKEFNGVLPQSVEELIHLPGVGRKTANLVVSIGFKKPALCIDVHCHRIPQRIGWFVTKTPYETEMLLRDVLPKKYWIDFNRIFVSFGQNICRPVSPKCDICPIKNKCKRIKK